MPDPDRWITAVRSSHDRLRSLTAGLDADQVTLPSASSEWSIADVCSHLGSQAEIFDLFLNAGLSGAETPGGEVFGPIWDRWNALAPVDQVTGSIEANERFVSRLEGLSPEVRRSFSIAMFGSESDLSGVVGMRLGEHAVHTWDVAVALDPTATIAPDAVELLIDTVGMAAGRSGKPVAGASALTIRTTAPDRTLRLEVDPVVVLSTAGPDDEPDLVLPAEAFIRLVFGRLAPAQTPEGIDGASQLDQLRTVFPGF